MNERLKLDDYVSRHTIDRLEDGNSCWAIELIAARNLFAADWFRNEVMGNIDYKRMHPHYDAIYSVTDMIDEYFTEQLPGEDDNPLFDAIWEMVKQVDTDIIASALVEAVENLHPAEATAERLFENALWAAGIDPATVKD